MANEYSNYRRYLVLNMINRFGPISRTGLIELTDSRPASIGGLIKELLDDKLIVETGQLTKGQGRRRLLLSINHEYLCAIGIGFTSNSVTYVVSQIDGTVLKSFTQRHPSVVTTMESHSEQILRDTAELCREFSDRQIIGIGIGDPPYDPAHYQMSGTILSSYTHFNDWLYTSLKPKMESLTGIPVRTFSPVTLPALAEMRFGAARDSRNFICVELSNGIGSSFCCNGQIVSGAYGAAGEIGHTVVDMQDHTICYCGKPGCVESSTSFPSLARRIRREIENGVFTLIGTYHSMDEPITAADIRRAVEEGDQMCRVFVRDTARRLGIAIANSVNLLNSDLVILHGFMTELGDYFLRHLEEAVRENVLLLSKNFRIVLSEQHESIRPLGAAAEVFSAYLHMNDYSWIYDNARPHPDLTDREAEDTDGLGE